MKKFKKLILTSGISLSSLFFNSAYSQEKEYYVGDPTYSEKEIKKVDKETFWKIAKDNNHYRSGMEEEVNKSNLTKWYVVPGDDKQGGFRASGSTPKTTQSYKAGSYQATPNSQVKFKSSNSKTTYQTTQPQNSTPHNNYNRTYIPPATKTNSNLGNALLIGGAAVGTALLINELLKPRNKAPVYYSAPPVNNPPTNYNSNPEENKKAFDEWLNGKGETENKKAFDEWLNGKESNKIKSLDDVLKEQEQKKAEAKLRSEKSSRELSDFVEKQVGASPETRIWFDKEYREALTFYKENCKVYLSSCEGLEKADKLSIIIGYNAYKIGKKTPAGPVLKGMEKYEEKGIKGVAEVVRDETAKELPGGELMLKLDKEYVEFMKDKNGKNYWEEGYVGSPENIENYWKEEVKKADEFYKEYGSNPKLKVMPNKKELEKILGTEVYVPKVEKDKYGAQINKIAYESDVSKVIRYRAYQYAKNQTEAGEIIEGIEKVDEIKKNDSKFFWDE